jgi:FlaG/FlaF family flagellin (archaellin)
MTEHHDRDTVVVKDGGSSTGMILGIIAIVIVLAGAWYFLMGPGAGTTSTPTDVNINVELPSIAPDAS